MKQERRLGISEGVELYRRLHNRPTFLQRNLRTVLAQERSNLHTANGDEVMAITKNTKRLTKPERVWNPEEIQHILQQGDFPQNVPVLEIEIVAIRDSRPSPGNGESLQSSSKPISASCSMTIWDSLAQDILVTQTRKCQIRPFLTMSKERSAEIELDAPFMVPLRQLQYEPRVSSNVSYSTQFVVMATTKTATWPPEGFLLEPKTSHFMDGAKSIKAPLLVAKWTRLPYLPTKKEEALLEIQASEDDRLYKPKLSLEFRAKWKNAQTPLEMYNRRLQSPSKNSAVPMMKADQEKVVVHTEWIFENLLKHMDPVQVSGYCCILCQNRRFTEPMEYHFHLKNNHTKFDFRYIIEIKTGPSGQSISRGTVYVKLADTIKSGMERFLQEINWVRPMQPFDLENYLKGDSSWLGEDVEKKTLPIPQRAQARSTSRDSRTPYLRRKRPISDIPSILPIRKRRFRVPKAPPGQSFYRTVSKVPLTEGDMLSESDDDINEDWLLQKHADTINSFTDTSAAEKKFMQRFDRHMMREDPQSDKHAEESIVRFCRQNASWLKGSDMRLEFTKKMTALKINGVIGNDILRACYEIITDADEAMESADDSLIQDLEEGSQSPGRTTENGHIYGRCKDCSHGIYDLRDYISCSNPQCSEHAFHISCVLPGSTQRPVEWTCSRCSGPKTNRSGANETAGTTAKVKTLSRHVYGRAQRSASPPSVAQRVYTTLLSLGKDDGKAVDSKRAGKVGQ